MSHHPQVDYDYSDETLYMETPPSYGDLAVNMALGITLVWLPLTIAAVGRTAFVRYRFTDKRISVITNAPWKQEQLDAAYQEVLGGVVCACVCVLYMQLYVGYMRTGATCSSAAHTCIPHHPPPPPRPPPQSPFYHNL